MGYRDESRPKVQHIEKVSEIIDFNTPKFCTEFLQRIPN